MVFDNYYFIIKRLDDKLIATYFVGPLARARIDNWLLTNIEDHNGDAFSIERGFSEVYIHGIRFKYTVDADLFYLAFA